MRRILAPVIIAAGLTLALSAQGPITPFSNLGLRATSGALNVRLTTASGAQGPITPGANILVRATSGALHVVLTSGQLLTSGTAPAVANVGANSCGTTAATIAGTDAGGKVTVGDTSGTQCRVTFATAYTNAPACVANNETTANLLRAASNTTRVDLLGTMVAADVLSYVCVGF